MQHTESQPRVGYRPIDTITQQKERDLTAEIRTRAVGVAEQLLGYALEFDPRENLLICFNPRLGHELTEAVRAAAQARIDAAVASGEISEAEKGRVILQVLDPELDALTNEGVAQHTTKNPTVSMPGTTQAVGTSQVDQMNYYLNGPLRDQVEMLDKADKVLLIRNRSTPGGYKTNKTLKDIKAIADKDLIKKRTEDNTLYCIFSVPTEAEAQVFGQTRKELLADLLRYSDRDWTLVEAAQKKLIEKIVGTERVEVISEAPPTKKNKDRWRTHLTFTMNGQIPVNSGGRRNMPGSEVFWSPERGTISGQYAVSYPFLFNGKQIPQAVFHLEDGKVVEFDVPDDEDEQEDLAKLAGMEGMLSPEEARKHIQEFFEICDEAREVGEFAIGTNPEVTKPTAVTLLIEKTLGIHLAFGSSYNIDNYLGESVNPGNGIEGPVHQDVANIFTPEYGGGVILLDDKQIFKDGVFMDGDEPDPELEILSYKAPTPQD